MNISRRNALVSLAVTTGAAALTPLSAIAQSGVVNFVVPYPPGSAPDVLARLISVKAQALLGQSIVVENRPGANAIIGSQYVSQARPDGSVYLLVDNTTIVANPLLYSSLPYDPKALVGITDVGRTNLMLTVRSNLPYTNWAEFVAYAKANPGKVSIGTGGLGSVHHLSLELIGQVTGTKLTHVPYKGTSPAVQDMLSGQIDGVISGVETIRPHMPSGKVRPLAFGGQQRSALLPEAPTLKELGVEKQVLLPTTFTLFAPPRTPSSVSAKLADAVRSVLAAPDTAARLTESGITPISSRSEDIPKELEILRAQVADVIKSANIQLKQ